MDADQCEHDDGDCKKIISEYPNYPLEAFYQRKPRAMMLDLAMEFARALFVPRWV